MLCNLRITKSQYTTLRLFATRIADLGGQAYYVGGCVRDHLLQMTPKDIDIEVFGVNRSDLIKVLDNFGCKYTQTEVGKSFGVFKAELGFNQPVDVSLPRIEESTGDKHTDFHITTDHNLSLCRACLRRDFTVNAMMINILSAELIDFFQGQKHLKEGTLACVSPYTFGDDPLRVFRAAQFCARLRLTPNTELLDICREILPKLAALPKERIGIEFRKLLLGIQPSLGLLFLRQVGALYVLPELEALVNCQQDSWHHPEGDVFIHTCLALDRFAYFRTVRANQEHLSYTTALAVLCHDLGKPLTTTSQESTGYANGVFQKLTTVSSHDHEALGVKPTKSLMDRLDVPLNIQEKVLPLVRYHLYHRNTASPRLARRLAAKISPATLLEWAVVVDCSARSPLPCEDQSSVWVSISKEIKVDTSPPVPILMGRHLIAAGLTPGVHFTTICNAAFELQLDGVITTLQDALDFVASPALFEAALTPEMYTDVLQALEGNSK